MQASQLSSLQEKLSKLTIKLKHKQRQMYKTILLKFIARRDARRILLRSHTCNPGHPVHLDGLAHFRTLEAFTAIGWQIFLSFNGEVSHVSILEFYIGYDYGESTKNVSLKLYHTHYDLDLDQFATLLGLPRSNHRVFTNAKSFSPLLPQVEVDQETILQSILAGPFQTDFDPTQMIDHCLTDKMHFWNQILPFNVLGRTSNTKRQEDTPLPSASSSFRLISNRVIYDTVLELQHSQNSFQRVQEARW
ncbi:hypothetical protein L6452_19909 [Arctium lappa]|uniref:Uncharacterized protein n=1 Tax=Arctium lappa TaxID=4217 RepID=A0ACB9BAF0_ARCLA|nr:hypothetical protein L6452_19909 [Arctium lappa]